MTFQNVVDAHRQAMADLASKRAAVVAKLDTGLPADIEQAELDAAKIVTQTTWDRLCDAQSFQGNRRDGETVNPADIDPANVEHPELSWVDEAIQARADARRMFDDFAEHRSKTVTEVDTIWAEFNRIPSPTNAELLADAIEEAEHTGVHMAVLTGDVLRSDLDYKLAIETALRTIEWPT